MVVRKRLNYGPRRGRQVPTTQRVPSSARGKRSTRKKQDETSAIDLLATVATSLADQEKSSNVPKINKTARRYARKRKAVKAELSDEDMPLKSMLMAKRLASSDGVCSVRRQVNISLAEKSSTRNETDPVKAEQFDEDLPLKSMLLVKRIVSSNGVCAVPRQASICLAENSSTRNETDPVKAEQFDEDLPLKSMLMRRRILSSDGVCAVPGQANICLAENSSTQNETAPVKAEQFDEDLPLKSMIVGKSIVSSDGVYAVPRQANICLAENSSTRNETDLVLESLTAKSNMSVKDPLFSCTKSCEVSHGLGRIPEYRDYGIHYPESTRPPEASQVQVHQAETTLIRSQVDGKTTALCNLVSSVDPDARPPALVSSDSSSGMPLCSHDKDQSSLCQAELQHAADRDDDENSSGCTHPSTTGIKAYMTHYIGDRMINKLAASKLRKAARSKMCGMSSKGSKPKFRGKKISTTRQRVQTAIRKKLVQRNFTPSSAKGILTGASGVPFSVEGQNPLCGSEDYHVKLRINSFTIPELLVEIPENATVGSLKRTVMDVVTSIIEGRLRVGVLLQGKNIQDDNKTLRQAGICQGKLLDDIDFSLECGAGQNLPPRVIIPKEMDIVGADVVEPLERMKCEDHFRVTKFRDINKLHMQASPNCLLSDPGSLHSLVELTTQETSTSSQAIIPVVPVCESKRPDVGQRRIRRPFSVAEVEALVEAVEQLGTGRWRAVKMHAFGNVNHRTYVDLKDKWKTLVHTASISPQLRRGEPVPQELLDRVLVAQAYWTKQQQEAKSSGQGSSG